MAQLSLSVQKIGNYSYLALEGVGIAGLATGIPGITAAASLARAGAGPEPPPLAEAMLGSPPTATRTTQARSSAEQAAQVPSKAWAGFFLQEWRRLNALAPRSSGSPGGIAGQSPISLVIEAPSIDETDVDWYAKLTSAIGITDPVTFTPNFPGPVSRYGRTFQVGDYVLIGDSNVTGQTFNYEIAQLAAISAAGTWTLARAGPTSAKGQARFGTPLVRHTPNGFIPIYRLIDQFWNKTLPAPASPQLLRLPWDSMCVPAVLATVAGFPPVLLNLIPSAASSPAIPGFRTLSGAEYTLGKPGAVALGDTSVLRLSVAGGHSIRNAFFELDGAAPITGNTKITLAYISPDRKSAYQIATFIIASGSRVSYATLPQNRRFPYSGIWPPHASLPLMVGALDANGVLQNGFTVGGAPATIQENGELDYIVTQNAATPGLGLRGTIQT